MGVTPLKTLRLLVLPLIAINAFAAMNFSPNSAPHSSDPMVPPQRSPEVQMAELRGMIVEMDAVFQRLTVMSPEGDLRRFSLGTNTPIALQFAPIGFFDLHPGDQVAVLYAVRSEAVSRVEKL